MREENMIKINLTFLLKMIRTENRIFKTKLKKHQTNLILVTKQECKQAFCVVVKKIVTVRPLEQRIFTITTHTCPEHLYSVGTRKDYLTNKKTM